MILVIIIVFLNMVCYHYMSLLWTNCLYEHIQVHVGG